MQNLTHKFNRLRYVILLVGTAIPETNILLK